MQSKATNPEEYLEELPEERRAAVEKLRKILLENLPAGFEEGISYGMLSYHVPHSVYPPGYHVDPKQPLPFINLASQKGNISLYHMSLYSDKKLLDWFEKEYPKHSKRKLDMGKSCIRFKKMDDIPYELIGELASKVTPEEWIAQYEQKIRK